MADKGVRLGVEVCGYLSEDKIAQMKNTYRLYYKDYFKVDERRIMFGDLSHIIKLYKQSQ
jgi:hypothetical protein